MKLALKCVVSLRIKSEKKLPLDNISLFLLFEIARSNNLFNMTALSDQNPKRRNTGAPKGQHTEGSKSSKSHDTSYPSLRQNIISHCCRIMSYWNIISLLVSCHTVDISYRTDTPYNTDISCLDILYSHYNNTPSWRHVPSCWYDFMLIYCVVSIADTIWYVYIEATAIICVTKINAM